MRAKISGDIPGDPFPGSGFGWPTFVEDQQEIGCDDEHEPSTFTRATISEKKSPAVSIQKIPCTLGLRPESWQELDMVGLVRTIGPAMTTGVGNGIQLRKS